MMFPRNRAAVHATVEAPAPPAPPARPRPAQPVTAGGVRPRERTGWMDVVLGLLACGVILLWLESVVGIYMPDDAYITYRYAENLAAGRGLVFNAAAAPVEGYSNLSWIVLLAGLARLGLDLPVWAANLGRLLSLLNLGLVYALSYQVVGRRAWALLAPALLALTAPYALWARGGLETMWYATLLLLSLWLVGLGLAGRIWAFPPAAAALFVLALTRHDGAIPLGVSGLLVLIWVLRPGRAALSAAAGRPRLAQTLRAPGTWVALGSFAGLALVYLGYTWWRGQYFGQLVPAPFFSRLGGTLTDPSAVSHTLASYFTRGAHYSAYGDLLVPVLAAAAVGWRAYRRPGLGDWLIAGCAIGLSLLYFASESYNPAIRYMVPVLPLFYLYAQLPLMSLLQAAWRAVGRGARGAAAVIALAGVVALFLLVMAPRTAYDGEHAETAKLHSLVPLGQWLHAYAPPGSAVALQDIGVVAYYSGLRVIDNNPGGLTNGDLIYRSGVPGFADLTLRPQPEFLVFTSFSYATPKFYAEFATLQQDPRFLQHYSLYGKVKYWEDRCYWLYKRTDVVLPPAAQAAFPPSDW
ncbi:MAG TPA: hypothetical protein VKY74_03860 [Chloroflexia bacterium]|nr:hypothetical protein [Chloroflexia bacterium]